MKKNICVVTSTRAEYGLLRPLLSALSDSLMFELQLVVTGTHLSPEFGLTTQAIISDGFYIHDEVEMLMSADSASATAKAMGLTCLGFSDVFKRNQPDALIILGDRYEILCVAATATVFNIPIIHLHGGEVTEGAIDDVFRHAITKLSHLHFTSTEIYRKRVIQMGEMPGSVYNVGAIGLDNIRMLPLLRREELAAQLGISLEVPYFLVTYHPVTRELGDSLEQVDALCDALLAQRNTQAIITGANADTGGREINKRFKEWATKFPSRLHYFESLGHLRYLSAMKSTIAVVGNSSSGILEAPSFCIPTLNIGTRQQGRICASSVVHSGSDLNQIQSGFEKIKNEEFLAKLLSLIHI